MRGVRLLVLVAFALLCPQANGEFAYREYEAVPVGRLFTNLLHRLAADTNDFNSTYHLARLHSMAYATNLAEVNVTKVGGDPVFYYPGSDTGIPSEIIPPATKAARETALGHLTNAIVLYERTIVLLKKSTNTDEQRWMILPTQLGLAWCLDQSGQRTKALDAYRKTLKIAWATEVTDTFELKEWLRDVWDDVRSGNNPIHSRARSLGPGVCYSEEVIGYLLKLLDPTADKKEIAELKERQATLSKMGRAITPLIVPLEPDAGFSELVNDRAEVAFDLDGSGLPRQWGWITPKAAWLVFDPKGKGQITSALQMFGNVTFWIFWRDGYNALGSLDNDGDGFLRGPELDGLALWQDRNGNGLSEPGEVSPVGEFGVASIACASQAHPEGFPWNPNGVQFNDGSVRPTYDYIVPSK